MSKEQTPMNSDRIKEIQNETGLPNSVSVQQALLKVWNECEQYAQANINSTFTLVLEAQLLKFIIWSIKDQRSSLSVSDMDELKEVIKLYMKTRTNDICNS